MEKEEIIEISYLDEYFSEDGLEDVKFDYP